MDFKKFPDIENSYRLTFLDVMKDEGLDSGLWNVTEKIHGSNFSMWFDGTEMKTAKRGSFLNPTDNFYMFQKVMAENEKAIYGLYILMKSKKIKFTELAVYGELFGGVYPHPDIDKLPTAKQVQKGVYYHPDNKFVVFDVVIDGVFLNHQWIEMAKSAGFFTLPIIHMGPLETCLQVDPVFLSHLFEDLPKIENNFAEGVVIRPNEPKFFHGGSRAILKNKNPKFAEKGPKVAKEPPPELSRDALFLFDELNTFIVENRLRNVISKFGEVGQKDFGALMKDFTGDVLKDFNVTYQEAFEDLDVEEQKRLTKHLGKEAADLIRVNFLNIIDGRF